MGRINVPGEEEESSSSATESDGSEMKRPDDDTVGALFLNKWVDIKDTVNNWCEAQIIDMDGTRIKVHYKGWKSKFDEWIDKADVDRIALINSKTKPGRKHGKVQIRLNEKCDVCDPGDKWCVAEIVQVLENRRQVKVHYVGWSDRYDEWLDFGSYRMAPLHRFTFEPEPAPALVAVAPAPRSPAPSGSAVAAAAAAARSKSGAAAGEQHRSYERPQSNFSASSVHEERFREVLNDRHGWAIVEMENDGNCLFRSISHQVYGTAEYHALVREKCVDYLGSESAFFRNYIVGDDQEFDLYCQNMRRDGVWGDNVEIQCLSEMYDRPVEVYAYRAEPMKTYARPSQLEPKPPIRLSYHFQSHYNSIVHPQQHHATTTDEAPGVLEDAKLRWSRLRSSQALNQAVAVSDVEATELESMRVALTASRSDFNVQQSADFDQAAHESVVLFEQQQQQKLQRDLAKAKEVSLQEHDSSDAELKRALQQSLADHQIPASLSAFEPQDIENALLEQVLKETREAAAAQNKSQVGGTGAAASASAVTNGGGDLSSWPTPVRHCHTNLGFSLEQCVEAYSIFGGQQHDVSEQIVIANMTGYLLNEQERHLARVNGFGAVGSPSPPAAAAAATASAAAPAASTGADDGDNDESDNGDGTTSLSPTTTAAASRSDPHDDDAAASASAPPRPS